MFRLICYKFAKFSPTKVSGYMVHVTVNGASMSHTDCSFEWSLMSLSLLSLSSSSSDSLPSESYRW